MRLIDIPHADQAARIRAAIGYSGKEAREIAGTLGVSYATLRRRYDRTNPSGVSSLEEMYAIADACGVPRAFMEEGFARFQIGGGVVDRVTRLEARADRQTAQIERVTTDLGTATQALVDLAAELREGLRGQLEASALEAIEQTQKLAGPAGPRAVTR